MHLLAIGCLMGLLVSPAGALGEVFLLRLLPAHIYSVVLSLEPAIAAAVGIVMLGVGYRPGLLVAIALLVAASIGISISHARAQKKAQEDGHCWRMRTITCRAVDEAHAVDIAQMATNSITIPSAEQIKADREAKGL